MSKHNTKNLFDTEDAPLDGRVVRVAFENGADAVFDYLLPETLGTVEPGMRVEVPFGRSNKTQQAFIVAMLSEEQKQQNKKQFKLKAVKSVIDDTPLLDEELLKLAEWISYYYVCPLGHVLAAMVPAAVKKGIGVKQQTFLYLNKGVSPLLSANDGDRWHPLAESKGMDENNQNIEDSDCHPRVSGDPALNSVAEGEPKNAISQEPQIKITGKKQKAIIYALQDHNAIDPDTSIEKDLLCEIAECTAAPLKKLLTMGIIKQVKRAVMRSLPVVPAGLCRPQKEVILNDDQTAALDSISKDIKSNEFAVSLLHGVTDSGKTEVYIRAIQKALNQGKTAIVLLPEIALTTQTINRFATRFSNIAVLHCQLTASQRNAEWQRIRSGNANVVIGARSAIFAPVANLGLVVVDEEHEPSYKQDTAPRYSGRDVAIKRTQINNAHCLLGSATPSLETLHNCQTKEFFRLLKLPKRVMDLPLPQMKVVDMSIVNSYGKTPQLISETLENQLNQTLEKREQAILLLNRRGYSNFIYCPSCRHTLHCNNCDVTLTFHKRKNIEEKETVFGEHLSAGFAICHYCMSKTLVPKTCPLCQKKMTMIGLGAQRLQEELTHKLPNANIARVDSDAMEGKGTEGYYQLLADFADGKIDILAGTQILAKGLHFPNVTLVGIVSADTSLSLPDFRANERTFQLISQVAGRAGRSEKGGRVVVQTYLPTSPAIRYAVENDFEGFVQEELQHRHDCGLPPIGRMAIIGLRDAKFEKLSIACDTMRLRLDEIRSRYNLKLKFRGPMPATINRLGREHRMQIVVQSESILHINKLFAAVRASDPIRPTVKITYDVDPLNII